MSDPTRIVVLDEESLLEGLRSGRSYPPCLVAAVSPGVPLPEAYKLAFERLCVLEFDDLEGEEAGISDEERPPRAEDLARLAAFVDRTRGKTEGYTVVCWDGRRLAPALAAAIQARLEGKGEGAEALAAGFAPGARPNRLLLSLIPAMAALPVRGAEPPPR